MNKSYRLLWSDIPRTWVAVSEVAKASGKRASAGIFEGIVKPGHYIAALCPYCSSPGRRRSRLNYWGKVDYTTLVCEPASSKPTRG